MAAELKLTKITPVTGTDIDVEGNLVIGTDAVPKALEVKGNLTVGVDIDAGGDIIADSIVVRNTPSASNELATVGYVTANSSLQNYITGFEISNNGSDSEHDIDIAAGICRDSTDATVIELSSTITKRIDGAWVVGNNQGGLDVGSSPSADTWYYLFAIYSTSTGSTDVLFSTSPTSPTMPSGYDYKRRIRGAVLTDGSANILGFRQKDNDFLFNDKILEYTTASAPTTATAQVVSVPPNFMGIISGHSEGNASGVSYTYIQESTETDTTPATTFYDLRCSTVASDSIQKRMKVDSSSQIYHRSSLAGVDLNIIAHGFVDPAQS